MKKILFLTLVLGLVSIANAQISTFPLADYARPDLQRKTEFLSGNFTLRNDNSKDIGQDLDTDFFMRGIGQWQQSNFINNGRFQSQSATRVRLALSYNKDNDFQNTINIVAFSPRVQRFFSQKRFSENQRFLEWGYLVDLNLDRQRYRDTSMNVTQRERDINTRLEIPLYVGKGRLELVNDAWHAGTILEFLEKDGLLTTTIDKETVQAFAERISEIKNFRNTDARLESLAEFEALCAYLVENQLVNPEAYRSFAVLLDAWQYESFVTRLSGQEWKFGLISSLEYDEDFRSLNAIFFSQLETAALASVAYNWHKPVSMDWQMDIENQLNFGPSWSFPRPNNNGDSNNIFLEGQLKTNWRVAYLPNQRSNYSVSLTSEYLYSNNISALQTANDVPIHTIDLDLVFDYQYYVSPKWAWTIKASVDFFGQKTSDFSYRNSNSLVFSTSYRLL